MKKKIIRSIFIIMLLFGIACIEGNSIAKIEFPKEVDFGIIRKGDTINKEIIIKNVSEKTLIIKNLHSSCNCTAVKLKDSVIDTDSETIITATFVANGSNNNFEESIVLESNTKPIFSIINLKGKIK
jgi:hypothetical protein